MKLPKIRKNLLVQELNDEVLVFDLSANKSYCLNKTAKTVFTACNGEKTFAEIDLPQDVVYLALDELKKQNLIENNYVSPFAGMNRREVIKKVGLASMVALPIISSLSMPSAANAASTNCGLACYPPGTAVCNACAGRRINYTGYPSTDGSCSGNAFDSGNVNCTAGITSVNDVRVNSFT